MTKTCYQIKATWVVYPEAQTVSEQIIVKLEDIKVFWVYKRDMDIGESLTKGH